MLPPLHNIFFFFNDTATTEIYTLSLHDALPICEPREACGGSRRSEPGLGTLAGRMARRLRRISRRTAIPAAHVARKYGNYPDRGSMDRLKPWERRYPAPAKLNLFLHVVGRRPDGYHLLQTAFRL